MEHSTLQKSFDAFVCLPFPKGSEDEALTDWIAELAELDGFYAGIATSLLQGRKVKIKEFPKLDGLFKELEKLHQHSRINAHQYHAFHLYLTALENLAANIRQLA